MLCTLLFGIAGKGHATRNRSARMTKQVHTKRDAGIAMQLPVLNSPLGVCATEQDPTEEAPAVRNSIDTAWPTKLDTKVDIFAWKEANDALDAEIRTVLNLVYAVRLDAHARSRQVDEILATCRHDITAVETNLEESRARIKSDTDQAVQAFNGRSDFTNKDLAVMQESLHTTLKRVSDCFNAVAAVKTPEAALALHEASGQVEKPLGLLKHNYDILKQSFEAQIAADKKDMREEKSDSGGIVEVLEDMQKHSDDTCKIPELQQRLDRMMKPEATSALREAPGQVEKPRGLSQGPGDELNDDPVDGEMKAVLQAAREGRL
mmetsp:Transcript_41267/g.81441  ORF Transcript_41267/g.81441 Transcript_41267/m.81441 type:complete len:320 (-) Transcript_41267:70-1029(-)